MINKCSVYIFGAGATKGAFTSEKLPPPVDANFFDTAKIIKGNGTNRLAKTVLGAVWELYQSSSGIGLERYYRDIETRGIIGAFAKTANQPKNWEKRKKDLEDLIRRIFIHTTCRVSQYSKTTPKVSHWHAAILKKTNPGDTIVTFNYDTVIEESMPRRVWNPRDGYGVQVMGVNSEWAKNYISQHNSPARSAILLLKLHGSLNWRLYRTSKGVRLKDRPYIVKTRSGKPVIEKISILAPGWQKPINTNPYKLFWKTARLKMENCKKLVIIGYSLPETDLLAYAMLAEIIRMRAVRKNYFEELHLVDPSERVKDRFVSLFMPAIGPTGRVIRHRTIEDYVAHIDPQEAKRIRSKSMQRFGIAGGKKWPVIEGKPLQQTVNQAQGNFIKSGARVAMTRP